MHLLTTAAEITQTGYNYYKCMNELAENIVTKIYFQQEKNSPNCSQKLHKPVLFCCHDFILGEIFLASGGGGKVGGFYFIQQTLLICN